MIDPCYWCGKNRCRFSHTSEIEEYRRGLHENALRRSVADGLLSKPRLRAYSSSFDSRRKLNNSKSDFWAQPDGKPKQPEVMSMADHWLKGFIQEAIRRGKSLPDAKREARARVKKFLTRNSMGVSNMPIIRFTKEERKNIRKYASREARDALKRKISREEEVLRKYGY